MSATHQLGLGSSPTKMVTGWVGARYISELRHSYGALWTDILQTQSLSVRTWEGSQSPTQVSLLSAAQGQLWGPVQGLRQRAHTGRLRGRGRTLHALPSSTTFCFFPTPVPGFELEPPPCVPSWGSLLVLGHPSLFKELRLGVSASPVL